MIAERSYTAGQAASDPSTQRLLHGNCLALLPTLADDSIDLILVDPPYGINYKSLSTKLPMKTVTNDRFEAYPLLDKALAAAYPKLKDGRWAFIFTNWQAYTSMSHIVQKYFAIKNVLIWEKNAFTRGDMRGNWGYQYEMVIAARKGATPIRRLLNGKRHGNILKFKKVPSNHMRHPTEKSIELLQYIIEKTTHPGEVVLDMFMGVGSTCVAAKQSGRGYVGIELEETWFKVAQERLDGG